MVTRGDVVANESRSEQAVVITKDTDEELVLEQSPGKRIAWVCLGGFSGLFFPLLGLVWMDDSIWAGIGLICGGLLLLLGGLYVAANRKEITFDRSLGYITIRAGAKRFPLRTRRISKTQIESVHVDFFSGSSDLRSGAGAPNHWLVSVRIAGKKVYLHNDDKQS
ncbi:unnamed protein product, partial [marine sediment metagenome]